VQSPKEIEERLRDFALHEPELSTSDSATIRRQLKELAKIREDLHIILDGGLPQYDVRTEARRRRVRELLRSAEEQILLHEQFLKSGGRRGPLEDSRGDHDPFHSSRVDKMTLQSILGEQDTGVEDEFLRHGAEYAHLQQQQQADPADATAAAEGDRAASAAAGANSTTTASARRRSSSPWC
jgi:hypothetical protein